MNNGIPMVVNPKEDHVIIVAPVEQVVVASYIQDPWDRWSQETRKALEEKQQQAREDPKMFDGPLVRVNQIKVNGKEVILYLQRTSYFPFVITRGNVGNHEEWLVPPDDCANPLSIGGLTVTIEDEAEYLLWLGRKNPKANELGGGQYHISPAGYVNPERDFSYITSDYRERLEEMLCYRPLPADSILQSNLDRELPHMLRREPFELGSRILYQAPFAIVDRYSLRNPMIAILSLIDIKSDEILGGFRAHHQLYKMFGKEHGIRAPEFDTMEPVEFTWKAIKEFYEEHLEELRPHARAALQALLMNWDTAAGRLEEAYSRRRALESTNL
ncbi:hypothetical protein DRJ48_03020 [Candidatus Woesearchaeota archaeon]|nr:hypothetical protein [Candidatus Woesearchaeota archaeon]RLE42678.1 MAG: hypothetical protein DRJ48_03020 [Candidatus Woesearchaeota archaeon]